MDEAEQYNAPQISVPANNVKNEPVEEDSNCSVERDIKYTLSEFANDFGCLKNVVNKLEQISDKLALAATADQYEHFGNYLATLLRGIPRKDFLSLKQKFISDVIRVKTALDEANNSYPVTGNCTVSETEDPLECRSVIINAHQDNASQHVSSERINRGSDSAELSEQRDVPACKTSINSGPLEVSVLTIIPAITSPSILIPPKTDENSSGSRNSNSLETRKLKRPSKSVISKKPMKKPHTEHLQVQAEEELSAEEPSSQVNEDDSLSFTEDIFEVKIEEGRELMALKSEMLETCAPNSSKTEHFEVNSQAEIPIQFPEGKGNAQCLQENVQEPMKEVSKSKRNIALTEVDQVKANQEVLWNLLVNCQEAPSHLEAKVDKVMRMLEGFTERSSVPHKTTFDNTAMTFSRLPVESEEDFNSWEEILKEPSFRQKLGKLVISLSGKDSRSSVNNIMRKILNDNVAEVFSLTGKLRTGAPAKKPFIKTESYKMVFEACMRCHSDCKEREIRQAVSDWLMQAKFRKCRRERRWK